MLIPPDNLDMNGRATQLRAQFILSAQRTPKRQAGTRSVNETYGNRHSKEASLRPLRPGSDGFRGRAVAYEFRKDYATSPTSYILVYAKL